MASLLRANFPGLEVRCVDAVKQPDLLSKLHALCPTRQQAAAGGPQTRAFAQAQAWLARASLGSGGGGRSSRGAKKV
jgi:hypothetical protein